MKVMRVLLSVLVLFGLFAAAQPAQAAPTATTLMIVAFVYQDSVVEYIQIQNISGALIPGATLATYRIGDSTTSTAPTEGMLFLPNVDLAAGATLILTTNLLGWPYSSNIPDADISTLATDPGWGVVGGFNLDDAGDEIMILDATDTPLDYVCYGTSLCEFQGFPGVTWTGPALADAPGIPGYTRSGGDTDTAADFAPTPTAIELKDLTAASSGRISTAVLAGAAALVLAGGAALVLRKRSR